MVSNFAIVVNAINKYSIDAASSINFCVLKSALDRASVSRAASTLTPSASTFGVIGQRLCVHNRKHHEIESFHLDLWYSRHYYCGQNDVFSHFKKTRNPSSQSKSASLILLDPFHYQSYVLMCLNPLKLFESKLLELKWLLLTQKLIWIGRICLN